MSKDLTVLPLRGPRQLGDTEVYCVECLDFETDYEIFSQISRFYSGVLDMSAIRTQSIPPQMWIIRYDEDGMMRTRSDDYGDELTFAYVKDLRQLNIGSNTSPKNKAIKAYIDALPEDTPIILFWH